MNDENCNYEVTGINAQFGYNPATTENNGCGCNNNNETCQKLLKEIREEYKTIPTWRQYQKEA